MSISNYSDLQTAVGNWLHRTDLTAIIPDLILLGEKRIIRDVRAQEMETAYSGPIAAGVIAVPTGFLGWKAVYLNTARVQRLETKSLDWIYQNYPTRSSDRAPKYIARNGSNFEFAPYPDSAYTVKGTYWAKPNDVATSWGALATAHPDLYLFAALVEGQAYAINAPLAMEWERKYQTIVAQINNEARNAEYGATPLSVTRG